MYGLNDLYLDMVGMEKDAGAVLSMKKHITKMRWKAARKLQKENGGTFVENANNVLGMPEKSLLKILKQSDVPKQRRIKSFASGGTGGIEFKKVAFALAFEGVAFNKLAKKKDEPSWWARQSGVSKAMRRKDSNFLAKKSLMKARWKGIKDHGGKGALAGATAGAAAGALRAPKGGRVGAALAAGGALGLIGGTAGAITGQYSAETKWLKGKGIHRRYGGLDHRYDEKAKKKYLKKDD